MPKVYKQKAGKDYPGGIKKGDTYYKWYFYRARVPCRSLAYPRPSQLTQSAWGDVYRTQEAIEDARSLEGLRAALESASSDLADVQSQYQEASDAMENTQGENPHQERADHLDELIGEVEQHHEAAEALSKGDGEEGDTFESIQSDALDLDWSPPN